MVSWVKISKFFDGDSWHLIINANNQVQTLTGSYSLLRSPCLLLLAFNHLEILQSLIILTSEHSFQSTHWLKHILKRTTFLADTFSTMSYSINTFSFLEYPFEIVNIFTILLFLSELRC